MHAREWAATLRPWNGDFAHSNVVARMHALANNYYNDQGFDDCARLMASGRFLSRESPCVSSQGPAGSAILPRLCENQTNGK